MREQRSRPGVLFQKQLGQLLDVVRCNLDRPYRVLGVLAPYLTEVEVQTDVRMRAARVLDVVDVERLIVGKHVRLTGLIPRMEPDEITELFLGEPLLPRVVDTLNDGTGSTGRLEEVRYSTTVAERIHGPTRFRDHVQVRFQPLVT